MVIFLAELMTIRVNTRAGLLLIVPCSAAMAALLLSASLYQRDKVLGCAPAAGKQAGRYINLPVTLHHPIYNSYSSSNCSPVTNVCPLVPVCDHGLLSAIISWVQAARALGHLVTVPYSSAGGLFARWYFAGL